MTESSVSIGRRSVSGFGIETGNGSGYRVNDIQSRRVDLGPIDIQVQTGLRTSMFVTPDLFRNPPRGNRCA